MKKELWVSESTKQLNLQTVGWTIDEFQKNMATFPRENILAIIYGISTKNGNDARVTMTVNSGGYDALKCEMILSMINKSMVSTRDKTGHYEWMKWFPWWKRIIFRALMILT